MARHHKSHGRRKHHESSEHHAQMHHASRDGFEGDGRGHVHGTTGHYPETEGQMSRFGRGDMIQEDRSKTANLPSDVQMTAYPNSYGFLPGDYLDDTIHGIDQQEKLDHEGMMKQFKPRKGF